MARQSQRERVAHWTEAMKQAHAALDALDVDAWKDPVRDEIAYRPERDSTS
ncbi:hypothetical protein HII36_05775 [Nonomuraea sp. NN258]|uniref:hypothetical protein n=1 Tax=Nonomuraea antri TaxID=2730852 RepID=UPI00156A1DE3|nr:hypothetical protein [Nonomuraea antri]NRQ31348.1 hypothetical protein [Nonomuraea antri]